VPCEQMMEVKAGSADAAVEVRGGRLEAGLGVASDGGQRGRRDDDLARTTKCPSRTRLTPARSTGQASCKIHHDPLANVTLAERGHIALQ